MGNYAGLTVFNSTNFTGLGQEVSGIGDINGDGIEDFAVLDREGFYGSGNTYARGEVYVVFGNSDPDVAVDLSNLDGTNGFSVKAERPSDSYGFGIVDVSGGEDVNGDGIADFAIAVGNINGPYGNVSDEAGVFVVFGKDATSSFDANETTQGLLGDAEAMMINNGINGDLSDTSHVELIADMNGDGLAEVLVNETGHASNYGFYGNSIDPSQIIFQNGYDYYNGVRVNVYGGGYYGSGGYYGNDTGKSYVVFGDAAFGDTTSEVNVDDLDGVNGFEMDAGPITSAGGEIQGPDAAGPIVSLGDVNGDGLTDIGGVDVYPGTVNRYTVIEYDSGDYVGSFTETYGGETPTPFVIFGRDFSSGATAFDPEINPADNLVGTLDQTPQGLNNISESPFGSVVRGPIASLGDINGDGFDDVAIVDQYGVGDANNSDDRDVRILLGSATGLDEAPRSKSLYSSQDFLYQSTSIAGVGDVNGDGIDDFVIGEPDSDLGGNFSDDEGRAFLVFGNASFMNGVDNADLDLLGAPGSPLDGYIFEGVNTRDGLGNAIASADINGDGINDIIIASSGADSYIPNVGVALTAAVSAYDGTVPYFNGGAAFVVFGSSDLSTFEAADVLDGDDNTIRVSNLDVNVDTGAIATELFVEQSTFGTNFISEGTGGTKEVTFVLRREGDLTNPFDVDFDLSGTVDASDFTDLPNPLTGQTASFGAGESEVQVTYTLISDADIENDELLTLTITGGTEVGATDPNPIVILNSDTTFLIDNDDFPPNVSVTGSSVTEGDIPDPGLNGRSLIFTIQRQGPTDTAMEFSYILEGGVGGSNLDLLADPTDVATGLPFVGLVEMPAGESSVQVEVPVIGDTIVEPRETVTFTITGYTGGDAELDSANVIGRAGTARIFNDDGVPNFPTGLEADVFGDPHIVTLDGLNYSFQAVGEFTLVESTDATLPLEVQIRTAPAAGSDLVSVTEAMATDMGGVDVQIDASTGELLVDGVAQDLSALEVNPAGIAVGGGSIFFNGESFSIFYATGEALMVGLFDDFLNVCVFLDPAQRAEGTIQGLMGNADGDLSNDFGLRDGSAIPGDVLTLTAGTDDAGDPIDIPSLDFEYLYGTYADSWRITDEISLFTYEPGDDTSTFTDTAFPKGVLTIDTLSTEDVASAEDALRDALGDEAIDDLDPILLQNAIVDFFATGDIDFANGATMVVANPEGEESSAPTDAPALPESVGIRADTASVTEGDSGTQVVTFTVYRIGDDLSATTEVAFLIEGDVDSGDIDGALSGSVTFEPGETNKTVSVSVMGDTIVEADEELTVLIFAPDGVLVASAFATALVENDDAPDAPPVVVDEALNGDEDNNVTGNLLANDVDPEGTPLSITSVTVDGDPVNNLAGGLNILSSGAHFFVQTDGEFTFVPTGFAITPGQADSSVFDRLNDGESATATIVYTVEDEFGNSVDGTAVIDISGVNDGPITAIDQYPLTEDESVSGNAITDATTGNSDRDPEGDDLEIVAINGVALADADEDLATAGTQITVGSGGQLTIAADGSFTFDTAGAYEGLGDATGQLGSQLQSVTYTVADPEGLESSDALRFSVQGVNDGPDAVDEEDTVPVAYETQIEGIEVLGNDTDPEGDDLTVTEASADNGMVEIEDDGTLTYTPNDEFSGADTITYTISDAGGLTDTATVQIVVGEPDNSPPVAVDDTAETDENTAITIGDVVANDTDADMDPLEAVSYDDTGLLGTLVSNMDGSFEYDPNGAFEALGNGQMATDSFTYVVSDGGEVTDQGMVEITINGVNDAPELVGDEVSTPEGESLVFNPLDGATDAEGDQISVESIDAANGAVAAIGDGFYRYTPNEGFVGVDEIVVVGTDGQDLSEETSIFVDVTEGENNPPVIVDTEKDVTESATLADNALALSSDPDDDPLTITSATVNGVAIMVDGNGNDLAGGGNIALGPDGALFFDTQGEFESLDDGDTSLVTVAFEASDGQGGTGSGAYVINVLGENDAPVAVMDTASTNEDTAITIPDVAANDTDIDNDPLSVVGFDDSALLGVLTSNMDGSFDYDPNGAFESLNTGQTATETFTYTLSDGDEEVTGTVEITINGVTDGEEPGKGFDPSQYDTFYVGDDQNNPHVGTAGRDWIEGGDGRDNINGLAGDDYIIAGPGNDWWVRGGTGADIFQFGLGDGDLKIGDWEDGVDKICLTEGLTFLDLSISSSVYNNITSTVLSTDDGDRVIFYDVDPSEIDGSDFLAGTLGASDPIAVDDSYSVVNNGNLFVADEDEGVLANDFDVNNDLLTANLLDGVDDGTLTLNDDGTFEYMPDMDFVGTDGFSYIVDDGNGGTAIGNVLLNIFSDDTEKDYSPADYDNQLFGDDGLNPIQGSENGDWIDGGDGQDNINGRGGEDYIIAGPGNDWWVLGGADADIFQFSLGDGDLKIGDWEDGLDRVCLTGGLTFDDMVIDSVVIQGVTSTFLTTQEGDRLIFLDAEIPDITAEDFLT